MKEKSNRRDQFYSKWEKRRKNKWRYVLLYGSVYWVSFGIILFLLNSDFKLENMEFSKLIFSIIFFGIVGIVSGLREFKRIDSVYLGLNDSIKSGIHELESGLFWDYENLKISLDNNKTIIVRNELFWYDKENLSAEELNECFNLILEDFRKLQKSSDFNEFAKDKKVKIQLFDNSENEMPLIEKMIKV